MLIDGGWLVRCLENEIPGEFEPTTELGSGAKWKNGVQERDALLGGGVRRGLRWVRWSVEGSVVFSAGRRDRHPIRRQGEWATDMTDSEMRRCLSGPTEKRQTRPSLVTFGPGLARLIGPSLSRFYPLWREKLSLSSEGFHSFYHSFLFPR